jgi:hypothetical protein
MVGVSKLAERRAFSEADYAALYPDIRDAIAAGNLPSGWAHYDRHGREEGRLLCRFDEAFYLRSYPMVAAELDKGLAATPLEHFVLYGTGRGYIPHPAAARAANPAAGASAFGGLWIDSGDAAARIEGRRETGQIDDRQAELLHRFRLDGYVILPNAIPNGLLEPALAAFDKAYAGGCPGLLFECAQVLSGHEPWRKEILEHPAKALDLHHFSCAIRRMIFAPAIVEFLGLIFEAKALASQTLGFLRGSAQENHQDSAYVPYTLGRNFAASWIALEDVTLGAGELYYWVGSHRLDDFLYDGEYKCVAEARRMNGPGSLGQQVGEHVASLGRRAAEAGLSNERFAARRGDVLIWHADLVHGGNPVSKDITRKSVVTHYCPKHLVPLFAETQQVRFFSHEGHLFTSSHYAFEPAD